MEEESKIVENQKGVLDPVFPKKDVVKTFLIMLIIFGGFAIMTHIMMWGISKTEGTPLPGFAYIILWTITFLIILAICALDYLYAAAYCRRFSYEISNKFITIKSGVLTREKTTIPFSRIQNITVNQGIIERIYGIYTVKIETAGTSGVNPNGGASRSEGFIPGVRDPTKIEQIINSLVHEYTQAPAAQLKGKVFENPNIAFDEFIAYVLSKLGEGSNMKTRVKEFREKVKMTQGELADQCGVSRQTINYLENGRYMPSYPLAIQLARIFKVAVETLFELSDDDLPKKA